MSTHFLVIGAQRCGTTYLRILLAEDNAVNQKLALRLLAQLSYEADVAGDGLAAIEAVEHGDFDVVLMDVQMPVLDGSFKQYATLLPSPTPAGTATDSATPTP